MPNTAEPVNEYYKNYWEGREQHISECHKMLLGRSQDIATEMGPGWTAHAVRDNGGAILNHIVHIKHPDYDYVIVMRFDERENQERFKFRPDGSFFNNKAIHKQGSYITVSANKSSYVIARDINRRLLPELKRLDAEAKSNYVEAQRYDNEINDNMWRLIAASNAHLEHSKALHQNNVLTHYHIHGERVEIQVYEHYVHFKLDSLSIEKAQKILKLLFKEDTL